MTGSSGLVNRLVVEAHRDHGTVKFELRADGTNITNSVSSNVPTVDIVSFTFLNRN